MALTQPLPPGTSGPVPSWDPTPPATAGPLSQGIVLVAASLALWLAASLAEAPRVGIVGIAVLAGSVGAGLATRGDRLLGPLPGLVAALLALLAISFGGALLGGLGPIWGWLALAVPLALIGLDWRLVPRLQALVAVSTFVLLPMAAADRRGAMATTLGWLVLAAGSMWSLEQDRRRGEARPLPLVPGATDAEAHPDDLLRTVLLALAIGVVAALVVSAPSCQLPFRMPGGGSDGSGEWRPVEPDPTGRPAPGDGDGRSGGGTTVVDGTPGEGTGIDGPPEPPEKRSDPRVSAWWLLLVVAVAALAAWFWWRRGRTVPAGPPDREWALALVEQIDAAGRARGRPRSDATTIRHHADDLAGSVLPDERLPAVGRVLEGALFGHVPVNARTRLWAQSVVDEILEANPAPRRSPRSSR